MRMTTKLVSLLPILFVFFKFGEPALVMMSIYGDKGFLFHSDDLAVNQTVGFVYDDANGAFAVTTCDGTTTAKNFTLTTDCTVEATDAVSLSTTQSTVDEVQTSLLIQERAAAFPATSVNTNMMVAKAITTPIVAATKTTLQGTDTLVTIASIVPSGGSSAATDADSTFLCNHLDVAASDALFDAGQTSTSDFGKVKSVPTQKDNYLPIMKCVAAVSDATKARIAFATFILIVTDHADISGYLNTIAFPSVVLFPQSMNQTPNDTTVVGYINGINKCSSNGTVVFASSSTTSCKGTISIGASGNYLFSYNGTTYYLPVTDASGANTSTTTCEDFAFNFKYSHTLIGMLLIFMLKMSQSY